MLTFRNTNIVFITLLVGLLATSFYTTIPWWIFVALVIIYSLILFYGSYFVHSNFFLPVICEGNTTEKRIALSFDDGPVAGKTDKVLNILTDKKIPAAFFCIGQRAAVNEALLKKIHDSGHLIGNHSYSHHFWFDMFPVRKMQSDIEAANNAISKTITKSPAFFRPPYGVTVPAMKKALQQLQLLPIGWNIRSMDTVTKDADKLFDKVTKQLRPGAILLFHDFCDSTISMLPRFIDHAHEQGYEFVRLDELINRKAYA